jgi:excisionase family DNA binding protein
MERLTTDQAADRLGISVDAVRGRIKRGTLEHEREGNKVYVLLEGDQSTTSSDESTTNRDQSGNQSTDQTRPDELVEVLTDQVVHLREQLAEEREARRRADTIIAQLAQSNEEQARTIRAIDSPRAEQNEGQEGQGPGPQRSTTPESEATREGDIERPQRSLWRRIFGG